MKATLCTVSLYLKKVQYEERHLMFHCLWFAYNLLGTKSISCQHLLYLFYQTNLDDNICHVFTDKLIHLLPRSISFWISLLSPSHAWIGIYPEKCSSLSFHLALHGSFRISLKYIHFLSRAMQVLPCSFPVCRFKVLFSFFPLPNILWY